MMECPLETYLDEIGETKKDFSARARLPWSTLFDILRGITDNPTIATLGKIEAATGGAVTIRMMTEWLGSRTDG